MLVGGDPAFQVERSSDGAIGLVDASGQRALVPAERAELLRHWLAGQLATGADLARARAEAAGVLGAELAWLGLFRGSRVEGAIGGLGRLVERERLLAGPGDPTGIRLAAEAMVGEVLAQAAPDSWRIDALTPAARSLVQAARAALASVPPDPHLPLRPDRHQAAVAAIAGAFAELAQQLRHPAPPDLASFASSQQAPVAQVARRLAEAAEALDRRVEHHVRGADQSAAAARDRRIADAYWVAAGRARSAQEAYQDLRQELDALVAGGATLATDEVAGRAHRLGTLAGQAGSAYQQFTAAVRAAQPARAALHAGIPASRLPHLTALTDHVNQELAQLGVDAGFTADDLESAVRSHWRNAASGDGAVLPVGEQVAGEVRIRFRPGDPVEVIEWAPAAAELIIGQLPLGGPASTTAEHLAEGPEGKLSLGSVPVIGSHLPLTLRVSGRRVTARSVVSTGADYAVPGAVADNRGPSTLFDVDGSWEFEVRTTRTVTDRSLAGGGWTPRQEVDRGAGADHRSLRLSLPHPYTDHLRAVPVRTEPAGDALRPFPEHVLTGLTGKEELHDRILELLGPDHTLVGGEAWRQVRALVEQLPARLAETFDGWLTVITDGGNPVALVRIGTTVSDPAREAAELVGTPSNLHHQERLRVTFSRASGGTTVGPSRQLGSTAGPKVPLARLHVSGGIRTGRARSVGVEAGGEAIHPSVQRYAGHTQAYRIEVAYTVTVKLLDGEASEPNRTAAGIRGQGLFLMAETEAYDFGLPVDPAAVRADRPAARSPRPDGRVLRDDPAGGAPEGRLAQPPSWLWGPDGIPGVGPGLVRGLTGAGSLRSDVEQALRARELLPELDDDGMPALARDRRERSAQLANLGELAKLSATGLEAAYDQVAQDGIELQLERRRPRHGPERYQLRIQLTQVGWELVGHTDAWHEVNLDIDSGRFAQTGGRSRERTGTGESGLDVAGTTIGPTGSLTHARGGGWTVSNTVNSVSLLEFGGQTAVFTVRHELSAVLIDQQGETRSFTAPGEAELLLPGALLPAGPARPAGPTTPDTPPEVLRRATPLHLAAGGMLAALREVLPRAARPGGARHHLVPFVGVRALIANPELLTTAYQTDLAVDPRGSDLGGKLSPLRASLAVRGEPGGSTFLAVVDGAVIGDILLAFHGHQVSTDQRLAYDAAATGGGTLGGGGAVTESRSVSRSFHQLTGRERLIIDTGRQYLYRMPVTFTVTGVEHRRTDNPPVTRTVPGEMVYLLAEREALAHYLAGRVAVPLAEVAGAIGRYLDQRLQLDQSIVEGLLGHVRALLAAATEPAELAADPGLRSRLGGLTRRLQQELSGLPPATAPLLPEHLRHGLGQSGIESMELASDRGRVELLDTVVAQLAEVAPDAVREIPGLAGGLHKLLVGDRWWGHLDEMLGPRGFELSFPVAVDGRWSGPIEQVTVRLRAALADRAIRLGRSDEIMLIRQDYAISDQGHTVVLGRERNIGARMGSDQAGATAGTDVGYALTGRTGRQYTQLRRISSTGVERLARPIQITVEVTRSGAGAAPAPVRLTGSLVQLVPALGPVAGVPGSDQPVAAGVVTHLAEPEPDPRLVSLPDRFVVEAIGPVSPDTDLYPVIRRRLAQPDLLGEDTTAEHDSELKARLSTLARDVALEQMAAPGGTELVTLILPDKRQWGELAPPHRAVPRRRPEVVTVRVEAVVTELREIVRNRPGVGLGRVDRIEYAEGGSTDIGRFGPLSRSAGAPSMGMRTRQTDVSASASHSTAMSGQSTLEETAPAATIAVRVDYHLTFEKRTAMPARKRHVLVLGPITRSVEVPSAAADRAYLTVFEHDLEAMQRRLGQTGPTVPAWLRDQAWQRWRGRRRRLAGHVVEVFDWRGGGLTLQSLLDEAAQRPGYHPTGAHRSVAEVLRDRAGPDRTRREPGVLPVIEISADATPGPDLPAPEVMAQLLARELGIEVLIDVHHPDGSVRRYRAAPGAGLTADLPDGGYSAAVQTLPPGLLRAARDLGLDLRQLFYQFDPPGGPGDRTFADAVRAAAQPAAASTATAAR